MEITKPRLSVKNHVQLFQVLPKLLPRKNEILEFYSRDSEAMFMRMNSVAKILTIGTPELFAAAVQEAARQLCAGEVVALPTETVYGLAANAWDSRSVSKIYEAKGRPTHNPLIVHVADWCMVHSCVSDWSPGADRLARCFWPGPLTLVVKKSARIPLNVTAEGSTVGIRWPSHPLMQAVIQACGFPLAAPSANLANALSPTSAEHVQAGLGDRIGLIIDGGRCDVGIESTVVDITGAQPHVLRPGMISAASILQVWGEAVPAVSEKSGSNASILRSPGLLKKHYSPRGKLVVWKWETETGLRHQLAEHQWQASDVQVIAYRHIPRGSDFRGISILREDPEAYARAIFAELHACDAVDVPLIVVELPPLEPAWEGIHDRLRRASAQEASTHALH